MSALSEAYTYLTSDVTLMGYLTGGVSSIWNMEDRSFPRVILGFNGNRIDDVMRGGNITVDLFYNSNAIQTASTIRDLIAGILQVDVMDNALRLNLEADGIVKDNDPQIGHWSMLFSIREVRSV